MIDTTRFIRFLKVVSMVLSGSASAALLYVLLKQTVFVNPVLYKVVLSGEAIPLYIRIAGGVLPLLTFLPAMDKRVRSPWECEWILRPGLLLWLMPYHDFPWILPAVLVLGYIFFRGGACFERRLPQCPAVWGWLIACCGAIALAAWGFFLQCKAFDTLYLIYGDWNQYAGHYQRLLSGSGSFIDWCSGCGHWNLGVNLLLCGALKIFYAPETVFLVNALCVGAILPLGYWLCRKCSLTVNQSLLFLIVAAFNPVLSNQFICHFYGFHPIIFFIPVIMLFFIARSCGCRWGMICCFLLSLLIQETVTVFWAGVAFYLLYKRKYAVGIVLLAAMVGLFFLLSSAVVPLAASGGESVEGNYSQMFHYAALGSTPLEVVMSPLLRPAAFWRVLFDRSSVCFMLSVFGPGLFALVLKPQYLLLVLPLLMGVVLQDSGLIKNVMFQYGLEITVVSLAVLPFIWRDILPELRRPSMSGVLAVTLLYALLLGFWPWSRGQCVRVLKRPDGRDMLEFVRRAAGSPERIIATGRFRGHFQFFLPTCGISEDYRPGDVIILDLNDTEFEDAARLKELRRRIVSDRRAKPLTWCVWENRTIVLYRIGEKPFQMPPIPWLYAIPQELFPRAGELMGTPFKGFEMRFAPVASGNIYRVMIKEKLKHDLEFSLQFTDRDGKVIKEALIRFGNGLFPADMVRPGTVFEFTIPLPTPAVHRYSVRLV